MKKILAATLVAAAVSFGIVNVAGSTAPEAEATQGDTAKCVTTREAEALRLFMPQRQAFRILDSKGKRIGAGPGWHDREYTFCATAKPLIVEYVGGSVQGMQAWSWQN